MATNGEITVFPATAVTQNSPGPGIPGGIQVPGTIGTTYSSAVSITVYDQLYMDLRCTNFTDNGNVPSGQQAFNCLATFQQSVDGSTWFGFNPALSAGFSANGDQALMIPVTSDFAGYIRAAFSANQYSNGSATLTAIATAKVD